VSPDPFKGVLEDPQSQHPYLYCHGNPIKYSDPSGYSTEDELEMVRGAGEAALGIATSILGGFIIGGGGGMSATGGGAVLGVPAAAYGYTTLTAGAGMAAHGTFRFKNAYNKNKSNVNKGSSSRNNAESGNLSKIRTKENLKKKANDLVHGRFKHAENYPGEYGDYSYEDILKKSDGGDRKARTMKEFIENSQRLLQEHGGKSL
jgi:hypothetical protein